MKLLIAIGLALATALTSASAGGAASLPKIVFGYTAVPDCVALFAAKEEGFFAKDGLDVDLVLVNNSSIEATDIAANAIQAGCNAPPVFLQAVSRGIGLQLIAGATVSSPTLKQTAIITRSEAGVTAPQDLYGKKIGVGGIGSNGYVLFGAWLQKQHLDPKRVSYLEIPFSTQYDVLKRGTVDGVISTEPMLSRIANDKTGTVLAYLTAAVPSGTPLVIYISGADWSSKNVATIAALRAALADGTDYATAHLEKSQSYIAQYLKQTLSVVQSSPLPPLRSSLSSAQMQWWADAMKDQGLLPTSAVPKSLFAK